MSAGVQSVRPRRRSPRIPSHGRVLDLRLLGYVAAKGAPGVLVIVCLPLLVASVGQAQYGVFSRVFAASMLASAGATGWLRQSALRMTGTAGAGLGAVPRAWILTSILVGSVPVGVYGVFEGLPDQGNALWLGSAAFAFAATMGISGLFEVVAQRDERVPAFMLSTWIKSGCLYALPLAAGALFALDAAAVLGCGVVGNCFAVGVLAARAGTLDRPDARLGREFLRYGLPMSLWLLWSNLTLYTDRFLVALVVRPEVAGLYAVWADVLVRGASVVAFPVAMMAHPRIMRAANEGAGRLAEVFAGWRRIMRFCTLAVFGAAGIGIAVYARRAGLHPHDVATLLMLAAAGALWQYVLIAHKLHEVVGRTGFLLRLMACSWVVQVAVNLSFVFLPPMVRTSFAVLAGVSTYLLLVHLTRPSPEVAQNSAGADP